MSPSPWSLAFYVVMAAIGSQLLIQAGVKYKRNQRMMAFMDALFLLGIIVCLQDTIWLLCNTWKWILPFYADVANFWNYYVRFAQNLIGMLLGAILSWELWKAGIVKCKIETVLWIIEIVLFTALVFAVADGQQFTDWTWAVSHGYSNAVILESFLISHVGYKLFITLAYLSLFKIELFSTWIFNQELNIT